MNNNILALFETFRLSPRCMVMRNSIECRTKAAALRACSLATTSLQYQVMFEEIACEWDRVACMADAQDRLLEGQDAHRADFRYH